MQNVLEAIVLIILFLFKIRDLVAQNFDLPLSKRWRWLIYNKKMQDPVLCSRVYERVQLFNVTESRKSIIERLLVMDAKHVKYFPDGFFYRGKYSSEIRSKYFINTLEASYVEEDLNIMTIAIRKLLSDSNLEYVDFVLFIKNGNQILAQNIFSNDNTIIYICKIDGHSSYVPQGEHVPIDSYSIQYENLDALLHAAQARNNDRNLTGVAIDCSISTGMGLKDSIKHFNQLLDQNRNLRINKIEHAFILYCHQNFDDDSIPFKLHRYFDMDEEIREMIYKEIALKDNKGAGARKVYEKLKEKNRIHNDK